MRQHRGVAPVLFLVVFLWQALGTQLLAQSAPLTPQELDQLLSPIALYPDSLLSQIMTASTNPQEILDVDNWRYANPDLLGTALIDAAQQQGFDPAFIALVNFPQVLEMMAQHIDDYATIGEAFTKDQGAVTDSIQRLRAQAYAAGSLRSSAQQTVEVRQAPGQTVYVIQPASPQVVYVPQYDPTVVYMRPSGAFVGASVTFGPGITIGALLVNQPWGWGGWTWNWGARRVYYNNVVWVGWGRPYRAPSPWYRPRPINWSHRPGYGGNWRYRPPNYSPPRPGNRPGYGRPPYGPGNRPGYRPGGNRPTPPPARPGGARPSPPPSKPNPSPPKPGRPPTHPPSKPTPEKPGTKPTRPEKPGAKPKPAEKPDAKPTRPEKPGSDPAPKSTPGLAV